jgi:hypothetical protein
MGVVAPLHDRQAIEDRAVRPYRDALRAARDAVRRRRDGLISEDEMQARIVELVAQALSDGRPR